MPNLLPEIESQWWRSSDIHFLGYASVKKGVDEATDEISYMIRRLIPRPPASLLNIKLDDAAVDLKVRDTAHDYDSLILAGHSFGGLIIRNIVRLALRGDLLKFVDNGLPEWSFEDIFGKHHALLLLAQAEIRLFAPALSGARLVGWAELARTLGLNGALLAGSKSYQDLKRGSPILAEIQRDTEKLAELFVKIPSLRANSLWASDDKVVCRCLYACDGAGESVRNTTHTSICKPTSLQSRQLSYIEDGLTAELWK